MNQERAVVVTGASKGIGRAVALRLARIGWRVYAGVRQTADGDALRGENASIIPVRLDVTRAEDIAAAAALVHSQLGDAGLSGLVNNAGIAVAGPLEFLPPSALREQLDVNVVAPLAVTQAFLPMLRAARGRIVNIGSIAGRSALPITGAYSASKFALEAISDALRVELSPWGIEVIVVQPGGVATPIWETSALRAEELARNYPAAAEERYGSILKGVRKRALRTTEKGMPAEAVARAVEHALSARRPRTRYLLGRDAKVRALLERLPDRLRDRAILRALAKISRDTTGGA